MRPSLELRALDHPLSTSNDSAWKRFHEDKDLWEEIEKDVKRTRMEMSFFYMALDGQRTSSADLDRLEMQARTRKADLDAKDTDESVYIESHADALARVLFIYA